MRTLPALLAAALAMGACGTVPAGEAPPARPAEDRPQAAATADAGLGDAGSARSAGTRELPEDWNLLHGLVRHCQQAFAGRVLVNETADGGADPAWEREPVVLDLRNCPSGGVIMAIAVADDRSRTMVLRQQSAGQLSLRHLRHTDEGQEQPVSNFGGFSTTDSRPRKAVFETNDISRGLFRRHDQAARSNSVWTLAMPDPDTLVYEEASDAGRLKLEFDLGTPVARPPAPWVEAAVR